MGPVVRRYADSDADACRRLWVELTEWHRRLYEDPALGGPDPRAQFDEHLHDPRTAEVFVAELDGSVVGLAGLLRHSRRRGELEPVIVAGAARGRGVGRALVAAAVEAARHEGIERLVVRPVARNAAAIRAFHALGFDVLGHVDLQLDLPPPAQPRRGERLAGRDFRV